MENILLKYIFFSISPDEPDAVCDHFERTPPMSTFTLGLVIANLKQLGNSTQVKDEAGNDIGKQAILDYNVTILK